MTAKIVAWDQPLLTGPGAPARANHVEVKVTNGVSALSVDIEKSVGKTIHKLGITPGSESAIELAIALLNGAYHVANHIHAGEFQSPAAFEHLGTAIQVLQDMKKHGKIQVP